MREAVQAGRLHWHKHALERFLERGVARADVINAILHGEVIEIYPSDRPYPSCLVLYVAAEPIHVVAAMDPEALICHIVTAYRPDNEHFESDFRTRRRKS